MIPVSAIMERTCAFKHACMYQILILKRRHAYDSSTSEPGMHICAFKSWELWACLQILKRGYAYERMLWNLMSFLVKFMSSTFEAGMHVYAFKSQYNVRAVSMSRSAPMNDWWGLSWSYVYSLGAARSHVKFLADGSGELGPHGQRQWSVSSHRADCLAHVIISRRVVFEVRLRAPWGTLWCIGNTSAINNS